MLNDLAGHGILRTAYGGVEVRDTRRLLLELIAQAGLVGDPCESEGGHLLSQRIASEPANPAAHSVTEVAFRAACADVSVG